ncbi:hypothetical protein V6N11_038744 [Hibiscus sabdariffa]|uniref:Uncharacterized protein n=1 Tax=Hibiscus sabdariffa TaxID=183260 RepID=A0ABR2SKW8_9ROSI
MEMSDGGVKVDAATEEPTSFERARILIETSVRGRIDEVVEVASLGIMFPIVVQEAELVWVPVVEQCGVVDGAALSEQSQKVDAATKELTSFERARILVETSVRGRIDEVVEVASLGIMFPIVVQDAELVWVPAVEQRGVVDGAALSEQLQEASVASPRKNSPVEQVGDDSPHWHANQLWEIESARKGHGASMVVGGVSDRVVCDRGGVCSEGDADFAFTRIRSREGLDIVHPSVSIAERDSLGVKVVGDCESAEKYGRVVGMNGEGAPSTVILGLVGATVAPVTRSAHGDARKVKSVNTLVEALGSPAQKRVIAAARSTRGRGRPAKVSRVVEAGVVANES